MTGFFIPTKKDSATHFCFPRGKQYKYVVPVGLDMMDFFAHCLLTNKQIFRLVLVDFFNCICLKTRIFFKKSDSLVMLTELVSGSGKKFILVKGSPGPNCKDTFLLIGQSNVLESVIKISNGAKAKKLLANEEKSLVRVKGYNGVAMRVPHIINSGPYNDYYFIEQSAIACRPITDKRYDNQLVEFLKQLHSQSRCVMRLKESVFYKKIVTTRKEIYENLSTQWKDRIDKTIAKIENEIVFFDMVCSHRDFVPWNMGLNANNKLCVFDWEYSDIEYPPLIDYFHFNIMPLALKSRATSNAIKKILRTEKNTIEKISNEHVTIQLLAYLLDLSLLYLASRECPAEKGLVDEQYGLLIDSHDEWC